MSGGRPERDYYYELTTEELRLGLSLTPFERLKRLDDLRRFVIMVRAAPTLSREAAEPAPADPYPGKPSD